ncbi:MAG TPA: MFS transporter [Hyphomicrobiales bacterium]|nr:MFS transporter [Hyphomicrobiales bacterium]
MATANSGARLDRLPISAFHRRIFWLIGAGMFFDGYDLYVGTNVLGATLASGFSNLDQNAKFISMTFLGLTIGSLAAGFLGDAFGRRFTYQINLLIFGIASFAAALAPDMDTLIWARFAIGIGLGAEIVVGYGTLTEFIPPKSRGKWQSLMAMLVVSGLPATALLGTLIIPSFGWRPMFVIAGVGAFVVWYVRKLMPESPRWLESKGRLAEADQLVSGIERESGQDLPPIPATPPPTRYSLSDLFGRNLFPRLIVGSVVLITVNTLIFGFVIWLPQFFLKQGLSITKSFTFTLVIVLGSPLGCVIGALLADSLGRRRTIIGTSVLTIIFGTLYPQMTDPTYVLVVGFVLIVCIYILVALIYGVYPPELFPTELRLRATGICNMFGRGATIVSPFIVVALFTTYGVAGVTAFMTALLLVQILVVWAWGIEPARRSLEDVAAAPALVSEPAPVASRL